MSDYVIISIVFNYNLEMKIIIYTQHIYYPNSFILKYNYNFIFVFIKVHFYTNYINTIKVKYTIT